MFMSAWASHIFLIQLLADFKKSELFSGENLAKLRTKNAFHSHFSLCVCLFFVCLQFVLSEFVRISSYGKLT